MKNHTILELQSLYDELLSIPPYKGNDRAWKGHEVCTRIYRLVEDNKLIISREKADKLFTAGNNEIGLDTELYIFFSFYHSSQMFEMPFDVPDKGTRGYISFINTIAKIIDNHRT